MTYNEYVSLLMDVHMNVNNIHKLSNEALLTLANFPNSFNHEGHPVFSENIARLAQDEIAERMILGEVT